MHATQDTVNLTPPQPPGMLRALVLALMAHALLLAGLTWGVHWKQTESPAVEAEIWSSVTQQAAPRAVEPIAPVQPLPPPAPPPPTPEPQPVPKPVPRVEPKVEPPPAPVVRDAEIALEREKKKRELEKQRQEDLQEKLEAKREQLKKAAADKKKQEQKEKELEAKREAQAEAAEAKRKLADAAEAKRKAEAAQAQKAQQQKQAEAQRLENIKRMQGMAGASGAANATGNALKSSGPSSSYGGKVTARVKPNITYVTDFDRNLVTDVEVRSASDGNIISAKVAKSSGNAAWDDVALRAIEKTATMPRDTDGTVPPLFIIGVRPNN